MSLTHITKCRYCDFKGSAQEFEPSMSNGPGMERVQSLMMHLLGHIQKEAQRESKIFEKAMKHANGQQPPALNLPHLEAWNSHLAHSSMAQGLTIFRAFETTDPGLNAMQDMARFTLHQYTRKLFFTDDMLLDAAVQMNLDPLVQEQVVTLLKGVRDALMEQGQYEPKPAQEPSRLIV